jgi:hypothetical protein
MIYSAEKRATRSGEILSLPRWAMFALGTIPFEHPSFWDCRCPHPKMNGNLKALAEGFSALNKRLGFDSKLPKSRTAEHLGP